MKEFIINKYLSLKLEGDKTSIYVDNKYFMQCKYLLLNIPVKEIDSLNEIGSIDEAELVLDKSLEGSEERPEIMIPPETEFWGHCSNLQVWYENSYDTRLLHRNLAFPLLRELVKAGNQLAVVKLKEEVAERLSSENENVTDYLINEGYIDFLNHEEQITAVLNPAEADTLLELEDFTGEEFYQKGNWINFDTGVDDGYHQFMVKNKSVIGLKIYRYEKTPRISKCLKKISKSFKNLEVFKYYGDNLSYIPDSFKKLKDLKELRVYSEILEKFPDVITELTRLEYLSIDSPVLKEFPESVGKLKNLRELGLGKSIEKIPKSILKLKTLENLYLSGNSLNQLPEFIYSLISIKRLNIRNTKLEKLSDSISELENLEYLNIKKNEIKEIPESLLNMEKLQTLFVDEKKLTEESLDVLKILKKKGIFVR